MGMIKRSQINFLQNKFLKSRDDWIRTSGLFVPNETRYRAALHPEKKSISKNILSIAFIKIHEIKSDNSLHSENFFTCLTK